MKAVNRKILCWLLVLTMVTAMIPFRESSDISKALAVTNSAKVESSPPDIPTTAFFDFV